MYSIGKTILSLALTSLLLTPSRAQDIVLDNNGIRIFEPGYFEEFDPITAMEMVYRMPGFSPQERDGGRGLSDVRTNLLINGERPPPKGQSIRQQLGEMPVSRVAYIELIDAGVRLDIDMQGYPQVANIVTIPDPPAYHELTSEVRRSGQGDLDQNNERNTDLDSTSSFFHDGHEFTVRANYGERTNQPPASLISIDPANPEQRVASVNKSEHENYGIDVAGMLQLRNDSAFSFNAEYATDESLSYPLSLPGTAGSISSVDRSSDSNDERRDLSSEYRRPLGQRSTLMLALVDAQSTDQSRSTFTTTDVNRLSLNERESGETALRLLITRTMTERLTLRTTATSAFNYFEGNFRLFEDGVEQNVEGSLNRVEEDRQTLEGAVEWTPAERWTVTGNLGFEQYDIRSLEAHSGNRTDSIGEATVLFQPQPRTTWSFESARDVGQLSFNQFLASSNLTSEILTAGANALEPERSSSNRVRYDRRFGDEGVLRFTLSRNKTYNPVRQVALSDSLVVSQNTSSETSNSLNAFIQYPFEPFGREDLILSVEGQIVDSSTIDPITGELRSISGNVRRYWSVQLRREPGTSRLAWGFSAQHWDQNDNYSVRRTSTDRRDREWNAYVEWEPIRDLKIRTSLNGPESRYAIDSLFPGVRTPDLAPSFYTITESYTDRSASISVEWRRFNNIEIRGSISSRPSSLTQETLIPAGEPADPPLIRRVATTPRATLRVRVFR